MPRPKTIPVALVQKHLDYDPETGELSWKIANCGRRPTVGSRNPSTGYRTVRVCGEVYNEARLIWTLMTGESPDPSLVIDHINGVRDDNRWCNLRLLTHAENCINRKVSSASGVKGVYPSRSGKWRVVTSLEGKSITHGTYKTIEAAEKKYLEVAAELNILELARSAS